MSENIKLTETDSRRAGGRVEVSRTGRLTGVGGGQIERVCTAQTVTRTGPATRRTGAGAGYFKQIAYAHS